MVLPHSIYHTEFVTNLLATASVARWSEHCTSITGSRVQFLAGRPWCCISHKWSPFGLIMYIFYSQNFPSPKSNYTILVNRSFHFLCFCMCYIHVWRTTFYIQISGTGRIHTASFPHSVPLGADKGLEYIFCCKIIKTYLEKKLLTTPNSNILINRLTKALTQTQNT